MLRGELEHLAEPASWRPLKHIMPMLTGERSGAPIVNTQINYSTRARALLYSSLVPVLQGAHAKMSASMSISAIFLTDTPQMISDKLEIAFPSSEDKGVEAETLQQYLRSFLQDDDELDRLQRNFLAEDVTAEHLREVLTDVIQRRVESFQSSRARITDEFLKRSWHDDY